MTASAETLREAREAAGLSAREAAALVGVTPLTWQRWEGQSSRTTEIPYAHWNLFLLLTGSHPIYRLEKKMKIESGMNLNDLQERMGAEATPDDAFQMRELLLDGGYEGQDTADIPEAEWMTMLDQAVAAE